MQGEFAPFVLLYVLNKHSYRCFLFVEDSINADLTLCYCLCCPNQHVWPKEMPHGVVLVFSNSQLRVKRHRRLFY